MPGTGSALRSGMDLDLRSLWLRVPPLLLSSDRYSNADRTRGRLRAASWHLKARCLLLTDFVAEVGDYWGLLGDHLQAGLPKPLLDYAGYAKQAVVAGGRNHLLQQNRPKADI